MPLSLYDDEEDDKLHLLENHHKTKQGMCFLKKKQNIGRRFGDNKMHLSLLVAKAAGSKAVVLLFFNYCFVCLTLFVAELCWSLFCYAFLCVLSSFAIILMKKRELDALLVFRGSSSRCRGMICSL